MAVQAHPYSENFGFPSYGSVDLVDDGCGINEFSFNLQQNQLQHMIHQQHHQSQSFCSDNSIQFSTSKSHNGIANHPSMAFPQSIAAQAEKQRQEMDRYITLQNERLRIALKEHRRQQVAVLLRIFESRSLPLLRRKDEEIAVAAKRSIELEDLLRKLEMERQTWQRVARENEAMILSLNSALEEMREKACGCLSNVAEDAVSCCEANRGDTEEETGENRENDCDDQQQMPRKMVCQSCNSRSACVLFLPCRHLCSCKACEAFLDSCPVCRTAKKATIDVLIF